jgi:hypothetical protein
VADDFQVPWTTLTPAVPLDKEYFVGTDQNPNGLFTRILPNGYLAPMLPYGDVVPSGPGWELFQAFAAIAAKVSAAVAQYETGNYIGSAHGGEYAKSRVAFSRLSAIAGAITIKAGTRLLNTSSYSYVTLADVVFGAGDLGPHEVDVRATELGVDWDCEGPFTAADGSVVPGPLNIIAVPYFYNPAGELVPDPYMTVAQVLPATGGAEPALDLLGIDRGLARRRGENDRQYAIRISRLPDTVTPASVKSAAAAYLEPLLTPIQGLWDYIEVWDPAFQTAWDAPPNPPAGTVSFSGNPIGNVFVFDDPRPAFPPRNRYLDGQTGRGCFIVAVRALPFIEQWGMVYDDPRETLPLTTTESLRSPLGLRATSAYDIPLTYQDSTHLIGVWDGSDYAKKAVYSGLQSLLDATRAAGVLALVYEG